MPKKNKKEENPPAGGLRRKVDTRTFVKKTGRDKFWKLLNEERAAITDKKTGEIYPHLLSKVECVICKSNKPQFIFKAKGFDFVRCKKCGLIYTNPRLAEEKVEKFYKGQKSIDIWADVLTSPLQMEYDRKKFDLRLQWLEKYTDKGKILDIGCSVGHFLKIAKDRGWDSYGLELNERAVKYAKEKFGITKIKKEILEKAGYPKNYFSAAGLWGVLEHILHPDRVLKELHKVLKPGGVVVISIPNAGSLAARILRERTSCFNGMVHLWFFNPKTIKHLLEKNGYKIIEMSSEQPELDTVWNYLNYEDPYLGRAKFPLDGKAKYLLEEMILKSNLGYKLIILAQKPKN